MEQRARVENLEADDSPVRVQIDVHHAIDSRWINADGPIDSVTQNLGGELHVGGVRVTVVGLTTGDPCGWLIRGSSQGNVRSRATTQPSAHAAARGPHWMTLLRPPDDATFVGHLRRGVDITRDVVGGGSNWGGRLGFGGSRNWGVGRLG